MLAVFALLAWKSRGWFRDPAEAGTTPALGPWPVAPDRVGSREELVRAFEYLALLRLGWAARSRNHLEVADQLGVAGGAGGERREAAGQLARLYERARYAPEDAPLSEADLAAARRDLTLLARVSPA
jgi:hypothetical protein